MRSADDRKTNAAWQCECGLVCHSDEESCPKCGRWHVPKLSPAARGLLLYLAARQIDAAVGVVELIKEGLVEVDLSRRAGVRVTARGRGVASCL